jgi:hypothetical protein
VDDFDAVVLPIHLLIKIAAVWAERRASLWSR